MCWLPAGFHVKMFLKKVLSYKSFVQYIGFILSSYLIMSMANVIIYSGITRWPVQVILRFPVRPTNILLHSYIMHVHTSLYGWAYQCNWTETWIFQFKRLHTLVEFISVVHFFRLESDSDILLALLNSYLYTVLLPLVFEWKHF